MSMGTSAAMKRSARVHELLGSLPSGARPLEGKSVYMHAVKRRHSAVLTDVITQLGGVSDGGGVLPFPMLTSLLGLKLLRFFFGLQSVVFIYSDLLLLLSQVDRCVCVCVCVSDLSLLSFC